MQRNQTQDQKSTKFYKFSGHKLLPHPTYKELAQGIT